MSSVGIAAHIGITTAALDDSSRFCAHRSRRETGQTPASLQELRSDIGQQGAIGLLIGLCVALERQRT